MRTITRTPRTPATPSAVAALFARQLGLATPAQVRALGVTLTEQRARIDRGEWEVYSPGVVGLCGVPDDWRRRPMAATLGSARVAVTGPTALRLHGLDGFRDETGLFVVARMADHPRLPDDCHLWRSRRLEEADVMMLDGIRTAIAPTALVHAAPIVAADQFGKALDDLLRRHVSPAWVQDVADRWSGRGVPGSSLLSAALAERCDARLPRSWFERLARRALAAGGIELHHEVPVFDGARRIALLDLADVRLKVAVECQSWAWHATPAARRADARRKRRLRRLGWDVTELRWSDRSRMDEVIDDVREALARQRILLETGPGAERSSNGAAAAGTVSAVDAVPLDVRPLRVEDWDDLVALFGTRGDPAWCWCQYFATTGGSYAEGSRQDRARRNKPALLRQVRTSERPLGVLARDGGEAVGWLALGPRQSYPRLSVRRATEEGAASEPGGERVWSTTCFVVKVDKRRRGVSGSLLAAGIELARDHGATVLEGRPVDLDRNNGSPGSADLYHGVASVFRRHGFDEVARVSPTRPLMRRAL